MRAWDNEVVVYEATSGNTHLLDTTAAKILVTIANAPADDVTLAQALAGLWPYAPREQAHECTHERLDAILADLAAISLITPVTP